MQKASFTKKTVITKSRAKFCRELQAICDRRALTLTRRSPLAKQSTSKKFRQSRAKYMTSNSARDGKNWRLVEFSAFLVDFASRFFNPNGFTKSQKVLERMGVSHSTFRTTHNVFFPGRFHLRLE